MNCCSGKVFFFFNLSKKGNTSQFLSVCLVRKYLKMLYLNHVGAITFKYTTEANLKIPSVHMERN